MAEKTPEENALERIQEAYLNKSKTLNLREVGLKTVPNGIGKLTELKSLYLHNVNRYRNWTTVAFNEISRLPPEIGALVNLEILNLSGVGLESLPEEIGLLTELKELYVGTANESYDISITGDTRNRSVTNNLSNIPSEILRLRNLEVLDLRGNLKLAIPPEILEKVTEPNVILDYYFSTSKKALNECKVIMIGQGRVGKTSLVSQLITRRFNPSETITEGIAINRWKIGYAQEQVDINIWDFGGQEIMYATHQFFLTKRSLYVLVLDSCLTQEENRVEYWLKIIQSFGGEAPVLVVGNKIDQQPLNIDHTELLKKYSNIVGVLETSAATGVGIEELKTAIREQVNKLPHVHDLLPAKWYNIKIKLEKAGKKENFITHDKYLELCAENEVSDEISQRTLIGFMHDLGVVLYFQEDRRLSDLGILNPQWVTNGVYKILNSHTLFQNKGVLTVSMLDEILNLPEYPRGKRLFIVDMMKKFELCYDIPYGYSVEADKTFLVPDLLPEDELADLKFNGVPAFEYAYPVLPSSVITRFIVRMNQKIDDGFVWRTGVVLKIGENKALVKADIEDRKITIAIDGVEHTRRDALSAIRYQLDEIHGSLKGLNPEKYVPVPGAPDADPLEYETLLMMEREGIETTHVKSGRKLVAVNVSQMLNGVESEYQRKQYGNVININGNVTGSTIIAGNENEVNN